jgi:FtsZ-binding cell division protein ZapB
MRTILLLIIVSCSLAYSQPAQKAVEDKNLNLNQRFQEMKAGSQTFKDYKVIKESTLDKVWSITNDSIKRKEQQLAEAKSEVITLREELETSRNSMKVQQASIQDVVYDSTHITVLGIPFSKAFFILLTAVIIGGLAFVISISFGRVKILNSLVKEKALIADSISHEFEDFKKKAMEKQTKLSRELQNERNKWQDYRKI